jgi:predicted SnoaL-like aldol condensation-catalyzing enzyme
MQTQTANDLSTNKRIAKNCLDMIFNQKNPTQAVEQYIGPNYRQHNPDAGDGPDGVTNYASGYLKANPDLRLDFKRIIAEGDYVVVHSHLIPNHSDVGRAVVDIFRCQDGKLVEHWDVIQPVARTPKNRNSMF